MPLEKVVEEVDESLIEARLNSVKQAALRIVTFCSDADKITESRRDLPSFGFRYVELNLMPLSYHFHLCADSIVLQNISPFHLNLQENGRTCHCPHGRPWRTA